MGHIVQVARRIWVIQIDGGRNDPMDNAENNNRRLDGPGSAKLMAQHRFGRTDGQLVGMVAKTRLDGLGLCGIVETSGGPMRVDIIHLLGTQPSTPQSELHGSHQPLAAWRWLGHMIPIRR